MAAVSEAGGYRIMDEDALRRWLAASPALAECLGGKPGGWTIRQILAHVEDFESIEDPARRAVGEANAIRLGRELILAPNRFSSIDAVAEVAQELAA